jgi:WD40 repeat protein
LAVSSVNQADITIYEVGTETIFLELEGPATGIEAVAFTHDGRHLLSSQGTEHDQTLLWDISAEGRPELGAISTHTGPGQFQTSPDQPLIAAFINNPPGFELLNANTGDLIALLPDELAANSVFRAVSPDFSLVGSLGADHRSTIRRLPSLEVVAELEDCTDIKAFSPDNSLAVVRKFKCDAPDEPTAGRVIEIATGAVAFELPERSIGFADFNPPGVLEGGRYLVLHDQASVEIWDVQAGDKIDEIHISDLGVGTFYKPYIDTEGRFLALPTWDGRVVVVDLVAAVGEATIQEAIVFDRVVHTGPLYKVSITRDGRLITGGTDELLRIWDLQSKELLVEFRTDAARDPWPVLSSDESSVLYLGPGKIIQRFYLDPERLVALAESLLTRGLTEDECSRYPVTCPPTSGDS